MTNGNLKNSIILVYGKICSFNFYDIIFSIFVYSTVKDSKCNAQEFNKSNNRLACMKELKEQGKTIVKFKKNYDS